MNAVDRLAALAASMVIRVEKVQQARIAAARCLCGMPMYRTVSETTRIPWQVIAAIHSMESDCSFSCHLHNGDPLSARTVHEPKGQPLVWGPPWSWEASALDALQKITDRLSGDAPLGYYLDGCERYNGLGYRKRGIRSPYLWGGTNHEERGRFEKDHVFNEDAIGNQIGVAPLLKLMGWQQWPTDGEAPF